MKIQDLFNIKGKTAIITGGGTHLGKSIATTLGELGAHVFIASRRETLCLEVASELRSNGVNCEGLRCDATDEKEVEKLITKVVNKTGRLDIMVCNAGGSVTNSYLPNASIDEFIETYNINVSSTYICSQAASKVMIPQQSGSIITLGSIHGFLTGDKNLYEGMDFKRSGPPYQAAKGAIINLTRALAAELGDYNITVNCISPGQIPRPGTDLGLVERCREQIPLKRTGTVYDIKGAVALLSTQAGSWITGQNIVIDGGWSIW
ncbi:MAG: gluconate 5-dehydrogenase [Chloroflexi bacterium]|nr:gluconate 5-dehydrogenase [Chloroflexota bacterium]